MPNDEWIDAKNTNTAFMFGVFDGYVYPLLSPLPFLLSFLSFPLAAPPITKKKQKTKRKQREDNTRETLKLFPGMVLKD